MKRVRALNTWTYWAKGRTAAVLAGSLLAFALPLGVVAQANTAQAQNGPANGAKFLSLKTDKVDVRQGPGLNFAVAWVFQRAGLPVEILRQADGWSEIRDAEGAMGWVQSRYLSLRRTVVVTGSSGAGGIALKTRATEAADTLVLVEPGIVANLVGCDGTWCQVGLADVRGYLVQSRLWGVAAGEIVK